MKITPNQDLASLTLSSISPSCRRGSVLRSNVPCSTVAGEYRRNGKKRRCVLNSKCLTDCCRIQRRLSRGSAFPEVLLHSPMDPIARRSRSCTDTQAITGQKDIQRASMLVASKTSGSAPTGDNANHDKPPDPDFSHAFDYVPRGYDPDAAHFDGLTGVRNEDFLIDLDTDSMER